MLEIDEQGTQVACVFQASVDYQASYVHTCRLKQCDRGCKGFDCAVPWLRPSGSTTIPSVRVVLIRHTIGALDRVASPMVEYAEHGRHSIPSSHLQVSLPELCACLEQRQSQIALLYVGKHPSVEGW